VIPLILSVFFSSLIFLIFKLFDTFKVNRLQAIVFNYGVACICGMVDYGNTTRILKMHNEHWFMYTVGLGVTFIAIFNLMGITAQRNGLSVVAVASKMSVVIPIIVGVFFFKESTSWIKILGLFLALTAIYLVSYDADADSRLKRSNLALPILVFFGSGFVDVSLKFLEHTYIDPSEIALFSVSLFASAFFAGILIFSYQIADGEFNFDFRSIFGGFVLGVANYFSIFFLMEALTYRGLNSSTIFTINNISVLVFTSILGLIFFKERLTALKFSGILLAIISIFLVSLSEISF